MPPEDNFYFGIHPREAGMRGEDYDDPRDDDEGFYPEPEPEPMDYDCDYEDDEAVLRRECEAFENASDTFRASASREAKQLADEGVFPDTRSAQAWLDSRD